MSTEVDPWWTVLVDVLSAVALVKERDPHGLVVSAQRADGTPVVVEIVMSPQEWNDLVSIPWGVVETAARHVRDLVLDQPQNQRYLVYDCHMLCPCDAPELPVDPDLLRQQELAAQYSDGIIPGGGWFAHSPDRKSSAQRRSSRERRPGVR
jgi:hypothetical protein